MQTLQPNSSIPLLLIDTVDSFIPLSVTFTLAGDQEVSRKQNILGFLFSHTFQRIRMKVDVQLALSPLTLIKLDGSPSLRGFVSVVLYTGCFTRSGLMAKLHFGKQPDFMASQAHECSLACVSFMAFDYKYEKVKNISESKGRLRPLTSNRSFISVTPSVY